MAPAFNTWLSSCGSDSSAACVEVQFLADGTTQVRNSTRPQETPVTFTPEEWRTFVAGVKAGEYDHPGVLVG